MIIFSIDGYDDLGSVGILFKSSTVNADLKL